MSVRIPRIAELGRVGGLKLRQPSRFPPKAISAKRDTLDPEVDEAMRIMETNDIRFATRMVNKQRTLPRSTLPEVVVYDWLENKGIPFIYQQELFGGRQVPGGFVLDFLLELGGVGTAWRGK